MTAYEVSEFVRTAAGRVYVSARCPGCGQQSISTSTMGTGNGALPTFHKVGYDYTQSCGCRRLEVSTRRIDLDWQIDAVSR
jgi:hypothetical protein